jgi:hypothetical protein
MHGQQNIKKTALLKGKERKVKKTPNTFRALIISFSITKI